jgi:hypothetical protein
MLLSETYIEVRIGKYLSGGFLHFLFSAVENSVLYDR